MATLNTYVHGPEDGPPVLAIHGVTAHGRRYDRLATEGLPGHRVVAVDLRGHGRSTWAPPWNAEQHVADLLETMDAHLLGRATIMGHSFGGLLATHIAAVAPARVERLVLLDPAIALDPDVAAERADESLVPPTFTSIDAAIVARREGRPPQAVAASDEDVHQHLADWPDGRFRFRYAPAAAVVAWSEMARPRVSLAATPAPTLLVAAGREQYVSNALRAGLADDLGDRLQVVVLDCGHVVYWDAFDETVAAIAPFLAG